MDEWPGVTPDSNESEDEGMEGEGFEMPAEDAGMDAGLDAGMGEMPAVAAMMKITPEMLTKLAESDIGAGRGVRPKWRSR